MSLCWPCACVTAETAGCLCGRRYFGAAGYLYSMYNAADFQAVGPVRCLIVFFGDCRHFVAIGYLYSTYNAATFKALSPPPLLVCLAAGILGQLATCTAPTMRRSSTGWRCLPPWGTLPLFGQRQ